MNLGMLRTRWAAVGAAVAVTLGAGSIGISYATDPADAVAFVPITPCRILDTRPAPDNIGNRNTPIGSGETHTVTAHGTNGDCTGIPATATGLSLNVTALGATTGTFLTIWADGATQPTASNLNPQPGQPPIPNAVTTGLSGAGAFNIFNGFGAVDVIVDINGYYTDHNHQAEIDAAVADRVRSDDGKSAYAWSCSASQGIGVVYNVSVNCGYDFNPSGSDVTVTRSATGVYSVSFPGLNMSEGHVQVSSYGSSNNWCKISGWGSSSMTVRCFNPAGAAADNTFTILALD